MKISLATITNAQDISNLNNNFSKLADALNADVLYRDNPSGEPNAMDNNLDMNSNDILNAGTIRAIDVITSNGDINDLVGKAKTAATNASNSAIAAQGYSNAAHISELNAADSAAQAGAAVSVSLLKANNLSDLNSTAVAKANLGLDNVDNVSDVNKPVSNAQAASIALKLDSTVAASTYLSQANANSTYGKIAGQTWTGTHDFSGVTIISVPTVGPSSNSTTAASTAWARNMMASSPAPIGNSNPNTGSFTTIAASGLINPSSTVGIKGTVTNDAVQAGSVGEYISSTSASTALVTATAKNLTSITLTPGEWDVQVETVFSGGTPSFIQTGMSSTSAVYDTTVGRYSSLNAPSGTSFNGTTTLTTANSQILLTTSTVFYLVASASFTGSLNATGIIRARRPR